MFFLTSAWEGLDLGKATITFTFFVFPDKLEKNITESVKFKWIKWRIDGNRIYEDQVVVREDKQERISNSNMKPSFVSNAQNKCFSFTKSTWKNKRDITSLPRKVEIQCPLKLALKLQYFNNQEEFFQTTRVFLM